MIEQRADHSGFWTPGRTAGLLAVLLPAVYLSMRPIDDVDVFWQVRIGQIILDQGFDFTEPLCYRQAGRPMSWLGWLGQVSLAVTHRIGGWEGVQAGHVLLYSAGLGLVWLRIRRFRARPIIGLVAVLLTFFPCMTNCSERPQTFAFFAFSLLVFAQDARWSGVRYWALVVPLLFVWQNVHPSVPIAVGVLCMCAVGRFADERWGRAVERGLWVRSLLTALVAAVTVFCTPSGFAVLATGARNAEQSRWLGIGEWQPASAMLPATVGFWMVLVFGLGLWVRCRARLAWRELLAIVLLTGASLYWTRMIVFWALFTGPTLARLLHRNVRGLFTARTAGRSATVAKRLPGAALAVTAISLIVVNPWVRPHVGWLPERQRALFDPCFPMAGLETLGRALEAGRIYNYREWGGMLALAGSPRWQVAIDGRIHRYDQPTWRSYVAVSMGRDEYHEVFDRDRPAALFLRPGHDRRLIERLRTDQRWHDYYSDSNCHIFLRRQHRPEGLDRTWARGNVWPGPPVSGPSPER